MNIDCNKITVTISGPQGVGKTQMADIIAGVFEAYSLPYRRTEEGVDLGKYCAGIALETTFKAK